MILKLINYSEVFGGQERFIQRLGEWLIQKNIFSEFVGGPSLGLPVGDYSNVCDVGIYNGNSALYSTIRNGVRDKLNVYVHHSDINDGQQSFWRRWVRKVLVKLLLKRFDLVVRVCNKALPDWYAPGKVVTIYNGVEFDPAVKAREPRAAKRWLMVGGVTHNKNQKLAIDTLILCTEATLTIVGDGPAKAELQAYCFSVGVASRVNWVGFVESPERYYEECDVLLMLSHYEAFPYVVLEAMARGMPVVAVPVGGVPEVLNSGNGLLLDDYQPATLARALNSLAESPSNYALLSIESLQTIQDRFTEEHCFQQLINHIYRLLNTKKGHGC